MGCLVCSGAFLTPSQKRFCSTRCAATYNNRGRDRHAAGRQGAAKYAVKACGGCGRETRNPKYCSRSCFARQLRRYSSLDEAERARRALHNEAWHRYMARRRNQTPPDVDVKALQQIYLDCPEGYEVDHRIPISRGGLHAPENLQYLPWLDNRRKWAHMPPESPPPS